jgi:hypothetical protein
MRDIAYQTMQTLEDRLGQPVLWVGAIHADHAPHLHAHLIAVVPKQLYVKDFATLRQRATEACLEQRRFLDLARDHTRERPYPLPTAANLSAGRHDQRKTYAFSKPPHARNWGRYEQAAALAVSGGKSAPPLRTCTCPRCQTVHIHRTRDPVHSCSCGLILHRQKQLTLQRKGREGERAW